MVYIAHEKREGTELYIRMNDDGHLYWEDNNIHGKLCIYQSHKGHNSLILPYLPFTITWEDIQKLIVLL